MAEHQQGYEINTPAKMDYKEHEKTYGLFLNLVKYGSVFVVSILLAMMVVLLASGGVIAGLLTFLAVNAVGYYAMR